MTLYTIAVKTVKAIENTIQIHGVSLSGEMTEQIGQSIAENLLMLEI